MYNMFIHAAEIKIESCEEVEFNYLSKEQALDFFRTAALPEWYAAGTAPRVEKEDWELIYEVSARTSADLQP
jgi:hypothetical protein